jgi:hypothetical protein
LFFHSFVSLFHTKPIHLYHILVFLVSPLFFHSFLSFSLLSLTINKWIIIIKQHIGKKKRKEMNILKKRLTCYLNWWSWCK